MGHQLGLGFNDLAGTGLFQSEYIVLSNSFRDIEYSFGLAWGSFDKGIVIDNPLLRISVGLRKTLTRDRGVILTIRNTFQVENRVYFLVGYIK